MAASSCHFCLQLIWPGIPPTFVLMDPNLVFILHNLGHVSPLEFSWEPTSHSKNRLLHPFEVPEGAGLFIDAHVIIKGLLRGGTMSCTAGHRIYSTGPVFGACSSLC